MDASNPGPAPLADIATPADNGGFVAGLLSENSEPDASGNITRLAYQVLGTTYYFDAAGYPGRTVGLQ